MSKKNISEEIENQFSKDDNNIIYLSSEFAYRLSEIKYGEYLKELLDHAGIDELSLLCWIIKILGKDQFFKMMGTMKIRYEIIKKLDTIIDEKQTREKEIQEILHENPWILNNSYENLIKEITIDKLKKKLGKPLEKCLAKDENKRLDLFGIYDSRRFVIIELKRPKYKIKEEALCQLIRYRYLIKKKYQKAYVYSYLICGSFDECLNWMIPDLERLDIYLLTYDDMVTNASERYSNLLGNIRVSESLNHD